jgi:hypothetical protein
VLAIIGSFGTWVSIHDSLGALPTTFHGSGFDNGRDGPFVLVLAVVALALGGVRLAGLRMPKWLSWAAIADGGLLVLVCIADTIDVVHKSHTAHLISPAITGGVGSGLWLALAGAVLVLAGAVVAIDVASRAPQYPAPAFPGAPPTPPAG